jgi:hypothetical protein
MPGAAAIPPTVAHSLSEEAFSAQVSELAGYCGWKLRYHTHDSRRSTAGFPDWIFCRPPELLAVELKTEKGRLSDAQRHWLQALEMCGIEVHVWRPSDLPSIMGRLKRDRPSIMARGGVPR